MKRTYFYIVLKKKRLAQRSFRRKLRSKRKKKVRNRTNNGVKSVERKERNRMSVVKRELSDYKHVKAPVNFSLTQNTEETLKFISRIEDCIKNRRKLFVDLSHVETIAHGAIVVLLSILVYCKTNNISFNGNYPKAQEARNTLKNSGFFKYLYRDINQQETYSFDNVICTHANKKVNSQLSKEIIEKASLFIWGDERRCTGVQRVFLELMQNTNNHASIERQGEKYWWASVNQIELERKVCFSFIDYGVGIFESLANKKEDNKFFNAINIVRSVFSFSSNSQLLKLLLNGDVHKTVTGKYYRGKGLPGIFDACKNNKISNLIIISNNAIADYSNNRFADLQTEFSGTFVYWELNENSINIKDNEN